jgi:hypothetical protein
LIFDPRVGFLQPCAERGVSFPMQITLNEGFVAVAAIPFISAHRIVLMAPQF